jgi:hypothetical protein
MPKRSGAPDVGDLVIFNPGDDAQPARLVIDTRGIEVLVMTEGWPDRWVRRDGVRIINESR